jgi:multicomponent Na+:H+ antiporter subunit C
MTTNLVLAVTIGGLFAAGVYLMLSRNLIRVILGFLLAGHSINLLLLTTGVGGVPPIVGEAANGEQMADPIPQALILTSIVISLLVRDGLPQLPQHPGPRDRGRAGTGRIRRRRSRGG